MEGDFKSRLCLYARNTYDMGQNKFEEFCGISRGTISAIPDNGGISTKTLAKIVEACPDLDVRWLLTGVESKGSSQIKQEERSDAPAPAIQTIAPKVSSEEIEWYRKLVESQQRTIEILAGKGASISQSISK
jgi:hypothetical protein